MYSHVVTQRRRGIHPHPYGRGFHRPHAREKGRDRRRATGCPGELRPVTAPTYRLVVTIWFVVPIGSRFDRTRTTGALAREKKALEAGTGLDWPDASCKPGRRYLLTNPR